MQILLMELHKLIVRSCQKELQEIHWNFYAGKDVKGTGKEVNLQNAEDKAANATDTRTEKKPNLEVTGVTKEKGEDMEENLGLT
ncbi:unnamed protein product [Sphagnum troendelagicum]|uniref:Uncharacterized protein n=1 Tax=Sphagnum troendelagicum TaxID=128251 RepID=A0ABP0TUH9_9BRYO